LQERSATRYQCDRQCRWYVGGGTDDEAGPNFFDRRIIGKQVTPSTFHPFEQKCCCYNQTASGSVSLDDDGVPVVPAYSRKGFQSESTWSGAGDAGFDCPHICATTEAGALVTMERSAAEKSGVKTVHCGNCSMCSAMADTAVIAGTRKWITEEMTYVASKFAAPWGYGFDNVSRLHEALTQIGFNLSTSSSRPELPSCMDCWTDNIMCDAAQCKAKCWTKFFNPAQTKECIECDERTCGAEFIKCAGANRRSAGIVSDIARPARQECTAGVYHGVPDADLPSFPRPTKDGGKSLLATVLETLVI
jgi:hypothetical protein